MSTRVDALRDLYLEVAGDEDAIVERQFQEGSQERITSDDDPLEEVSAYVREDGLDDALDGVEVEG